jgi:hypothetical protein
MLEDELEDEDTLEVMEELEDKQLVYRLALVEQVNNWKYENVIVHITLYTIAGFYYIYSIALYIR